MEFNSIDLYSDPEFSDLLQKIQAAQTVLAEEEAFFSLHKHKIDLLRADLFKSLRKLYQERDRLHLVAKYRREFLEKNLQSDVAAATRTEQQFRAASKDHEEAYEEAFKKLSKKKALTKEEEAELRSLWKQLVKLFHPDLVHDDPEKAETFHNLTQAINQAKAAGDLEILREIAADPEAFLRKKGWANVDLGGRDDLETLKARLEMLLKQIDEVKAATEELLASDDYKLLQLCKDDESVLKSVIEKQRQELEDECARLKVEADELQNQIREATGIEEPLIK